MVGACVKSEATAAAEHSGKKIMHDPMAMRPFMGYNFGKYLEHWLSLNTPQHKVCFYFLDYDTPAHHYVIPFGVCSSVCLSFTSLSVDAWSMNHDLFKFCIQIILGMINFRVLMSRIH